MSEGHEENQDMQRISKKIKNCEACLSEDTPCVPQRVLQQREKNVVEAGEESRVRRGLPGPLPTDMQRISKKTSPQALPNFFLCAGSGAVTGSVTVTVTVAVIEKGLCGFVHIMDSVFFFLLIDVFRFFWYNTLVLFWRL